MPKNGSNLKIISSKQAYSLIINKDSTQKMVSITTLIPSILLDLRYASTQNFMHRTMYPPQTNDTYLRLKSVNAIKKIQSELNQKGLGLKIFDAYRPYSVTQKFWDLVHDERYVANPANGSGHNRGTTVDLTIINLSTGKELDMGTGFDSFSDSAHHNFTNLSAQILSNRLLLKQSMEKAGFKLLETEWWHYSWKDTTTYDLLNLSFNDLKKFQ